jgi:uncharacterized protein DUF2188
MEADVAKAVYRIVPYQGGQWGVSHDGDTTGPYVTREAAFEAAVAAGSVALKQGHAVEVSVPAGPPLQ